MRKKFTAFALVAALGALLVPATSMAVMSPLGHEFEIAGGPSGPKIVTPGGSCTIGSIKGKIPTVTSQTNTFEIPAPTVGSCTSGMTATFVGPWRFVNNGYMNWIGIPAGGITFRFAASPTCKVTNSSGVVLTGLWSNGVGTAMKSQYHGQGSISLVAANNSVGTVCATAGKQETYPYEDTVANVPVPGPLNPALHPVTDLTSPSTPILITP
jgi:hypothetical protein